MLKKFFKGKFLLSWIVLFTSVWVGFPLMEILPSVFQFPMFITNFIWFVVGIFMVVDNFPKEGGEA